MKYFSLAKKISYFYFKYVTYLLREKLKYFGEKYAFTHEFSNKIDVNHTRLTHTK